MILVFGGTTEGRQAVETLDEAGTLFYYSTRGDTQVVHIRHGERLSGALDEEAMIAFCQTKGIRLLVDAAHPFAERLRETIAAVARRLTLPVVRWERRYPPRSSDIHWCASYEKAMEELESADVHRLLALTGVQTIVRLKPYWRRNTCFFRVLNRPESIELARRQGFPLDRLCFYDEADHADETLFSKLRPEAILTKESGESGGFNQKIEAARRLGIAVYAVVRPSLPKDFIKIEGPYGLRREVERLVPGFFPLRTGLTTGTCATVAAVAALTLFLKREPISHAEVVLPDGERLVVPVTSSSMNANEAVATVLKDAGDDPDVTDGAAIEACVAWLGAERAIVVDGGEGVGRVTLPGLGIPVGEAAINVTPRRMLRENLESLLQDRYGETWPGVRVTIRVPEGLALAKRTFNPRLGIVGGISILGTSGIVKPFSSLAFVDSIRKQLGVALAASVPFVVINSGARGERYLQAHFFSLPPQAFVQYGNFVGETLRAASEMGVRSLRLGIMVGKAVKLAEGHLDTHSHKVVFNRVFLSDLAKESGCSSAAIALIGRMTLARELWKGLDAADRDRFFPRLLSSCLSVVAPFFPGSLSILLLDEMGEIRYTVSK